MPDETAIGGAAREFPPTRWTLVRSSRESEEARRAALRELLEAYWKPIYFYIRRKGRSVEDAKDAVQGFYAHLLDRDFLARLDPAKGRLRSYLRTAVDHFLINEHEKRSAKKRGGGARILSLDMEPAEREFAHTQADAGAAFDRAWALGVMERAMGRLRCDFEDGLRSGPFEVVERFFGLQEAPSYATVASEHGMSIPQLKAFLHRARGRFRVLVREEIADTVADAGETDAEYTALLEALGS